MLVFSLLGLYSGGRGLGPGIGMGKPSSQPAASLSRAWCRQTPVERRETADEKQERRAPQLLPRTPFHEIGCMLSFRNQAKCHHSRQYLDASHLGWHTRSWPLPVQPTSMSSSRHPGRKPRVDKLRHLELLASFHHGDTPSPPSPAVPAAKVTESLHTSQKHLRTVCLDINMNARSSK